MTSMTSLSKPGIGTGAPNIEEVCVEPFVSSSTQLQMLLLGGGGGGKIAAIHFIHFLACVKANFGQLWLLLHSCVLTQVHTYSYYKYVTSLKCIQSFVFYPSLRILMMISNESGN